MILDSFREEFPAPESRRDSGMEVEGNWKVRLGNGGGNGSKVLRRKRMEIRRRRSVSDEDLLLSDLKKAAKIIEGRLLVEFPENEAGGGRSGVPPCKTHGAASSIGRRREMEDTVAVELDFMRKGGKRYDFFGVYDGHGGRRVAQACGEMLHKVVVGAAGEEAGNEVDWPKVMEVGFKRMDEEVNRIGAAVATVGTTAVVAVVVDEELVVANCGDSRAVLSRGGGAVQLSDDHKADRPDEVERIESCGGRVINWNGQRVMGVLATSRSIGDDYLKPFVTPEPEVTVVARTGADEFLILASDGLWDVVSNDIACHVVRKCLRRLPSVDSCVSGATKAAAMLVELAMARGSQDNISVVVVKLDS